MKPSSHEMPAGALPLLALLALVAGCGKRSSENLAGTVILDGSSTVYPISQAVAEEFQQRHPEARIEVAFSGTRGGFARFLRGASDINDASSPITAEELARARSAGVDFIEIPIAFDGLTVVMNRDNDWVDHLSIAELRALWRRGSEVRTWRDLRPGWPDQPIHLFGPGKPSGTQTFLREVIGDEAGDLRSDFTAAEDDQVLVEGVAADRLALGYFGFGYYAENAGRISVVPIDSGRGVVTPSRTTIEDGSYAPLSRPLFLYVNAASARRPLVRSFVEFFIENAARFAAEAAYVPLSTDLYDQARARLAAGRTGCWASRSD